MNVFYKILEVLGIVAFVAIVLVTILFAEGYQYDSTSKDIVKKSVITFASISDGALVYLNGQRAQQEKSSEFRLLPGKYELEIKEDGYAPWKKTVDLKENMLIQFPGIRLLSSTDNSNIIRQLQPVAGWEIASHVNGKILLENKNLHYWKEYLLDGIKFEFKIYDSKGEVKIPEDEFVLKNDKEVFRITEPSKEPGLFFGVTENVEKIINIQETNDYFAFILGHKGGSILVVTKKDGSIVFQERGVQSVYVENDKMYYTTGGNLIKYSIEEKKVLSQKALPYQIKWLSRVGDTYHFLFVAADANAIYCDEEFENCSQIIKLDAKNGELPLITTSKSKGKFFTISGGQFTLLDFEGQLPLLPFLKNLVSGVF